jgi:adenylate cyclase
MSPQEQRIERRLAAIFAADVAGYSRLMSQDEAGTLRSLTAHREVMDRLIAEHGGRIANTAGDSVLAEFPSVVDAVQCAVAVQEQLGQANAGLPNERRLEFRIGVHVGDVMVRGADLLGDGINIAARLQSLAEPGGLWLSSKAYEEIEGKLPFSFEEKGEQEVKNITRPIRAYALAGLARAPSAQPMRTLPLPDKPSIAVLPFTNLSGDPEQEYFADGVVEEIITALSRFPKLFVIARNSSFAYKGRATDVREVGRVLGVRYVLEGSVRKAGNRVRLTAQLIEAGSGAHLWADKFDGELGDIFTLQDEITEKVIGAIEPRIRTAEIEGATRRRPTSLTAYDLTLRALSAFYSMTREGLIHAEEYLTEALAFEPEYGSARSLAALVLVHRVTQGWAVDPQKHMAQGLRLAREALDVDKDDPDALAVMGLLIASTTESADEACAYSDRSVAINPNSALAWSLRGWTYQHTHRDVIAIDSFLRAIRLSPFDPMLYFTLTGLGFAYLKTGQFEAAVDACLRATRLNSHLSPLSGAWRPRTHIWDARKRPRKRHSTS